MKKVIIVFFLLVVQFQLQAQFNPADYGKLFDGTIILKSGEIKQRNIRYHHPGVLMQTSSPLETESEGSIDKGLIETFYVNGQCWVERSTPGPGGKQWVILVRQGAIEHVQYFTGEFKGGGNMETATPITADMISKGGQSEIAASMVMGYKKKMAQMVSDYPELAAKVTNGESGYGFVTYLNVVDEYNKWFAKNNPGKVKLYPWFVRVDRKEPGSFADARLAIQHSKDSVANAQKALAASRPAVAPAAVASKKANIPPKKETFSAKVKRYEAEGHKIGVIMDEPKTKITATIRATNAQPKSVGFEGDPEKPLEDASTLEQTISELNKVYGTTIFEAVQMNQIPLVAIKSTNVDDWWSTCYKTVVSLSLIREFNCSNDMMTPGAYEGTGRLGLYANVFEHIDDGKNTKDAVKRYYALGFGVSETFKYAEKDFPITFDKLEAMVDWGKVKERYESKRVEQFAKLVDKWD